MAINFTALTAATAAAKQETEAARLERIFNRRYYGLLNAARAVFKANISGAIRNLKANGLWDQYVLAPGCRAEDGSWTQPEVDWTRFWQEQFQMEFDSEFLPKSRTVKGLERAITKIAKAFHDPNYAPIVDFLGSPEDGPAWLGALEEFNRQCYEARKAKEAIDD